MMTETTQSFSKAIYSGDSIQGAITAFKDFAEIECTEKDTHFIISLHNCRNKILADEIANYILMDTIENSNLYSGR